MILEEKKDVFNVRNIIVKIVASFIYSKGICANVNKNLVLHVVDFATRLFVKIVPDIVKIVNEQFAKNVPANVRIKIVLLHIFVKVVLLVAMIVINQFASKIEFAKNVMKMSLTVLQFVILVVQEFAMSV